MRTISLPIMVCGELHFPQGDDVVELEYINDLRVRLPQMRAADVTRVIENRENLAGIPLATVSEFLSAAGQLWVNPQHKLRREAVEHAEATTGYSRKTLEYDYWTTGDFLMFRNNFYDLLDAELGSHTMLDEWVRNQVARVRAYPRGRALHVLVGNVPLASVGSMVRSILTRNHTVVKLPARDPVTSLYFARALVEANGLDHPLSRSLSVAYWDHDSEASERLLMASDVVCAWGRGASLEAIKRRVPHSVPYVEFGPKRSFGVVYAEEIDVDPAALRIAHDISLYDQEACFSPQRLFVIGDPTALVASLAKHLDDQAEVFPPGQHTPDVASHVLRSRLEARFRNWKVIEGECWTILVCKDGHPTMDAPLSRTILVHPVTSLSEIASHVDDETQTVTVLPHDRAVEVADVLCDRGSVRVCEGGLSGHFRQGFTHDGGYPLQQFVRLAHIDAPLDYTYKYGPKLERGELEQLVFGLSSRQT
jgi:long-chain-fatty-acyl-CoA reductase